MRHHEELARFACGLGLADLPAEVLDRARLLVADTIPVVGAGMRQPEMQALLQRHLPGAASGRAWAIGAGRTVGPLDAALLNGTAGTWLELNEGNLHSKGHPGIQVTPAALAQAQASAATGEALLLGVVAGYEVCSRIGRAAQVRINVHPHGTWGTIGAAVAAGKILGFDEKRMATLINVAASMGMATSRQTLLEGSTVRNIFTGHAGYMGLMATRLVESGFTGEKDAVASVFGGVLSDGFDPALAVKDLGRDWLLPKGYIKLHPTGRYVHSVLDALEDLLSRMGKLDIARIARIDVRAYRLAAMLKEKRVTSSFGARFSVPFALATVLHHGRSGLEPFEQAAVDNPAVQAIAAKVEVEEDASFTARYPGEQPVELRVTMADGAVHEGRCTITKGEVARPHTREEIEGKFRQLARPLWGEAVAERLWQGCRTLEAIPDFARFSQGFDL